MADMGKKCECDVCIRLCRIIDNSSTRLFTTPEAEELDKVKILWAQDVHNGCRDY